MYMRQHDLRPILSAQISIWFEKASLRYHWNDTAMCLYLYGDFPLVDSQSREDSEMRMDLSSIAASKICIEIQAL